MLELSNVDLGGFSIEEIFAQLLALNSWSGQICCLIIAGSSPGIGEGVVLSTAGRQAKVAEHAAGPVVDYDQSFSYLFYPHTGTAQAAGQD